MISRGSYSQVEIGGLLDVAVSFSSDLITDRLWSSISLPVRVKVGHHYLSKEFKQLCKVTESVVRPLSHGKRMKFGRGQ